MTALAPLDAALGYLARGWPVFPCRPDEKAPLTPHGFKDATTDLAKVVRWWSDCPSANVAIATGAPAVDVLDVDNRPEGNGFEAFGRLARAGLLTGAVALVNTPSGGAHTYFVGTGQRCGSLRGRFLDFKASGGYVLAPPSRVEGRPYVLIDERGGGKVLDWAAVRRLLDPPRPQRTTWPRNQGSRIEPLAGWLATCQEGNRNNALFWATCCALEEGGPDVDLTPLVESARGLGLDEREIAQTIASARRKILGGTS